MILNDFDAIIFDFGGVLIDIDYDLTIQAFEKLGVSDFQQRYSQANQIGLFDDLETGKISPQAFINKMLEFVPSGVSANKIVFAWNSMLKDVPMETIDILIRLKQSKIKVYLLSNTNAIHIDAALRKWEKATPNSFYDMFDKVYLSHEIGLRKPTKEIFDFVIDDQQLIPSKTLFIDDSVQHIEGAKLAGLTTHHLKKIDQLKTLFS